MIRIRLQTLTSRYLAKASKLATQSFKVRTATFLTDQEFLVIHCLTYKLQAVFSSHCRQTREGQFSWDLLITLTSSVTLSGIIRQHRVAEFTYRRVTRKCATTCFTKILWPHCQQKIKAKPLLYQKVLGGPFIFRVSTRRASKLFFSLKTSQQRTNAEWS